MATQLLLGLMAVSMALGISNNVDMSNKSATQEIKYVAKITKKGQDMVKDIAQKGQDKDNRGRSK